MKAFLTILGLNILLISCFSIKLVDEQQSFHEDISDEEFAHMFPKPLIRYGDEERCRAEAAETVFTYAKCPETPYELTDITTATSECASHQQFGCEIQFTADMKIICTFNVEKVKEHLICPGDKVVFEKVKLNQFSVLRYYMDLRADPLRTDVYILTDATGSMGTAIHTAKMRAREIINLFKTTTDDTAFAVGYYRDEVELSDGFRHVQSMTTDYHAVERAINGLAANGGKDADEANLVALYRVATDPKIGWREKSRRIIIYMGDQPGHEPTCVKGVDRTITRTVVAEALEKERISVLAIDFRNLDKAPISFGCGIKPPNKRAAPNQGTYITDRSRGALVKNPDQTKVVELIEHLIRNLPRKFDYDDRDCGGKVLSNHSPRLPLELLVGDKMTVTNTLNLQKGVCEMGGYFKCQVRYLESGADLKPTEVEFLKIEGCEA